MSRDPRAVRVYGAAIRLYPRRFRDDYGRDMVSLLRDQCRDEPAPRVLVRAAVDLAITIPTQRLEAIMHRTSSPLVPIIYLTVALAGLLLAALGGSMPGTAIIGLPIALVAGAVGVIAWHRAAPVRETTPARHWWKLVLAGPCLVALVIIGSGLGVDAWSLGVVTVFTGFALTAVGVVLGLSLLWGHRTPRMSS